MGVAAAGVLLLKGAAAWIALQWVLQAVVERVPRVRVVLRGMKVVEDFVLVAGTTLCALLVLLPSFVFVVLEVFRYVQVRSREERAKTVAAGVERIVGIVSELEDMGEGMRVAAVRLNLEETEVIEEKYEEVIEPEQTAMLPRTCGNVLLAVCRHSETLERLYTELQPPAADELIYCDCDDFEIRAEKVISLIGILRECMERQTDLVKTVNDLYPIIPASPIRVESPIESTFVKPMDSPMMPAGSICNDEDEDIDDDSGFVDE